MVMSKAKKLLNELSYGMDTSTIIKLSRSFNKYKTSKGLAKRVKKEFDRLYLTDVRKEAEEDGSAPIIQKLYQDCKTKWEPKLNKVLSKLNKKDFVLSELVHIPLQWMELDYFELSIEPEEHYKVVIKNLSNLIDFLEFKIYEYSDK